MKMNVIDSYMEYKISYLIKYALLFFEKDKNDEFLKKCLKRYITTYVNFCFYHRLETLDKVDVYDFSGLKKEFKGIEIELLDEYSAFELVDTNEGYRYNQKLIRTSNEICFELCRFDQNTFESKEIISDFVSKFIKESSILNANIGNNLDKFILLVKSVYVKECKFFDDREEFFSLKFRKIKGSENLVLVDLIPNIKMLEVNYKKILINRVFNDDKLNKDKMTILIQKLSKEILRKVVYGEHLDLYVVNIFDNMFYRNKFLLSELLDNDLLKQYLVFMSNFNTYNSRKNFFSTNNFKYACLQDCLHINDVVNKFNVIDAENVFNYIIINDYKIKDKEDILKYECSNALGLFIDEEV